MTSSGRSKSVNHLQSLYQYSQNIQECREVMTFMMMKEQERGYSINQNDCRNMEQLCLRLNRLHLLRHDEIIRIYSNAEITREIPEIPELPKIGMKTRKNVSEKSSMVEGANPRKIRPSSPPPVLKVHEVIFKSDKAIIHMDIDSGESDRSGKNLTEEPDSDIVYPPGVTDRRPYQTIAKFRRMMGLSTDFTEQPLELAEDKTETTVLGLATFAEQHGCPIVFTEKAHGFDNSIYRAACGVADLGSIHLLATDAVKTATFDLVMDFDFHHEFQQSAPRVERFAADFCQSIADVLACDPNNVRLFSIGKLEKEKKKSEVKVGLTSSDITKTTALAKQLQNLTRAGFGNHKVLRRLVVRHYDYTWTPALQVLKICPKDLEPAHNFDYRSPFSQIKDTRGGYDYFFPRGWYRHGLKVLDKYGDPSWIGSTNSDQVWPVAYHGTKSWAVNNIVQEGLKTSAVKTDAMRSDAVKQKGAEMAGSGLYVATHCDRGASIYTEPFEVTSAEGKLEKFRIVFQCRVQPGKFTVHKAPVNEGEAWRFVDPNCIRPYGILLKKED